MASIAIVVSILALLVAGATCLFTYRQAKAARDQAAAAFQQAAAASGTLEIEEDRSLTERTPLIYGAIRFMSPVAHQLTLGLRSGKAVTIQGMRFIGTDTVEFASEQEGQRNEFLNSASHITRWVRVGSSYPAAIRLEVTCQGTRRRDKWVVPVDVLLFPELRERQPRFDGKMMLEYPQPPQLQLVLKTSEPVAFLEAAITAGYGVQFLRADGQVAASVRWEELAPGGRAQWPIAVTKDHSEEIDLTVNCKGRKQETWCVTESIRVRSSLARPGKPKFDIEIQKLDSHYWLMLRLRSQWPLTLLEAEIDSDTGVKFIASESRSSIRMRHGQLAPGQAIKSRLDIGQWNTAFFRLDLICTGPEQEKWELHETVMVPSKYRPPMPSQDDESY
jgi:hypothetical protein